MTPDHAAHDTLGHEQRLAAALGALVRQADLARYRDELGHPLENNQAFRHAQAIVEEFGVTHEDICQVLGDCADDPAAGARALTARGTAQTAAKSTDTPPEYRTWTTGP
jgi:hypothetical protein